jgi:hypothetical protein
VPDEPVRCPSARCEPGAVLLGIVLPNGRVAYAADRFVIDEEFVTIARQGRSPEARFRFSSPCLRGACREWTGERCGVIDEALRYASVSSDIPLPQCSIRSSCRWFAQVGAEACGVCPLVVTDPAAAPVVGPDGSVDLGYTESWMGPKQPSP